MMLLSLAVHGMQPQYEHMHDKMVLRYEYSSPHIAKLFITYLEPLRRYVLHYPQNSSHIAP